MKSLTICALLFASVHVASAARNSFLAPDGVNNCTPGPGYANTCTAMAVAPRTYVRIGTTKRCVRIGANIVTCHALSRRERHEGGE